ncbi:hypothetical protein HYU21_03260 [Candidatus Woesearchaeota archaeon]|nr:hypothetical protein [Candidatus Woesearchaeota archaeon]
MVTFGGPADPLKISIEDLLKKELHCETKASDYKAYGASSFPNTSDNFLVSGRLFGKATISPYNPKFDSSNISESALPKPGIEIGGFTIFGVIEDKGSLLAFKYQISDKLPRLDPSTYVHFKDEGRSKDLIDGQIEVAHLNYLHLNVILETPNPKLHILGKIKNSSPRLFLTVGMMVETDSGIITKHGYGDNSFKNNPVYR